MHHIFKFFVFKQVRFDHIETGPWPIHTVSILGSLQENEMSLVFMIIETEWHLVSIKCHLTCIFLVQFKLVNWIGILGESWTQLQKNLSNLVFLFLVDHLAFPFLVEFLSFFTHFERYCVGHLLREISTTNHVLDIDVQLVEHDKLFIGDWLLWSIESVQLYQQVW